METWIKLYRKFSEWEWFNISEMVHLFIYLLLNANNSENEWRGIKVKRGQLITGRNNLSENTGISSQTIRTCLNRLKSTNEITIKSTNKYSIITICNYEVYQGCKNRANQQTNQQTNQQLTSNQPATNQQLTTIKEYKNIKNDNNEENIFPPFENFKNYALENSPLVNISALELKYKAWVENKWRDGNNKKILNWKTKLLNTIPYLYNNGHNRQDSGRHEKRVNDLWK